MKKYVFEVPEDWDLKNCFIKIDKDEIRIDRPVDHCIFEVCKTKITALDDDPYYSTLHDRIGKCVSDLRDHFSLGYIADPCGGIQALEITALELMNY